MQLKEEEQNFLIKTGVQVLGLPNETFVFVKES